MTRTDIANLFPGATEEQISGLLDINGADINKVNAKLTAAQEENSRLKAGPTAEKLQAEIDKAASLQKELDAMKQADTLRLMREKVATEKNIPANLLTGDTEDACTKQADAILAFAKPGSYPAVKDGGDPPAGTGRSATRDSFAGWFNQQL